jgi:hypothetical protein
VAPLSARWRRRVHELGVDRLEAIGPGQFGEVEFFLGHFLALGPAAEAAEVLIIDIIDGHRPDVGVPLLLRGAFAETQLGGRISRNRFEVLLRNLAARNGRAQPAGRDVLALRCGQPFRPRAGDQITLNVTGGVAQVVRLVWADFECA